MGALLDGANRAIRQLQNDIADSRSAVNNMQTINGRDMTGKRQLESSIHTLQAEVDGMLVAAKNAEEKAKKAMVDAARLADELRAEQEHVSTLGTGKNSLNNALGELEGRLSDAENAPSREARLPWPSSRARSRPTSSRSRRPRRSPPSTWPSSARLSRSSRRPRSVPSSQWFSKLDSLLSIIKDVISIRLPFKLINYISFDPFSL